MYLMYIHTVFPNPVVLSVCHINNSCVPASTVQSGLGLQLAQPAQDLMMNCYLVGITLPVVIVLLLNLVPETFLYVYLLSPLGLSVHSYYFSQETTL